MRSRFVLAALLASAVLVAASTAMADNESAAEHFDAGVAFFNDGDYMAAMIEFKKAYELEPNYRVLYNLGQTSRELRDYAAALKSLRRYLEQGGDAIDPERRERVERWIEELKKRVGSVTLDVNVDGAEVAVDDIVVGETPLSEPLVLSAGRRKIEITKAGYAPITRRIDLAGRESRTLELDLAPRTQPAPEPSVPSEPVPAPAPPSPEPVPPTDDGAFTAAPFVLLGTTAALGAAAGAVGGVALSKKSDFDEELATVPNDADAIESARSEAETMALAADVLAGFAVAAGIGTIIAFSVEAAGVSSEEVAVEVGPSGLRLRGAF